MTRPVPPGSTSGGPPARAGRVVLVTGASSGIGAACASHLAGLGHRVYGTSRRADDGARVPFPELLRLDVRDDASVRGAVGAVLAAEGRIDALVNNAGAGIAGAIADTSPKEARDLFETNVFGALRTSRAVLPAMRERGEGWIVNVGSLAGRIAIPYQGLYSASKAALALLSDALRMEERRFGIRVTCVEPGDFRTGFTAARRFVEGSTGSVHEEHARRAVAVMERDEQHGAPPDAVARLVGRLVGHPSPRPRYVVAHPGQRLAVRLAAWLPAGWVERAVARTYGG